MAPTGADLQKIYGHVILFIGVQAYHWSVADIGNAARFARSVGADSICVKRCDGSIKWYGDAANLRAERAAALAAGVGYVPMLYSYGPKFGDQQIRDECACLIEMAENNGNAGVLCDMETEWDNQVAAAQHFEQIMRPAPIILGVTSWADPAYQGWIMVTQALAPAVNYWVPQQYDNWLAEQPLPSEVTIVQPGIDLSQEFGPNGVVSIVDRIAARGESCWIWEYTYAEQNPGLMRQISAILHAEHTSIVEGGTVSGPESTFPETYQDYTTRSEDLADGVRGLAARYGVDYATFCAANKDALPDPDMLRSNLIIKVPAE